MNSLQKINIKWPKKPTPRAFWKRYYYDYLTRLTQFLTPAHAKIFFVDQTEAISSGSVKMSGQKGAYDYVIANDCLGYIQDIELFLREASRYLTSSGRIIITQYNTLWEPILLLASLVGLRNQIPKQNWISPSDLENFSELTGLEIIKSGTKMLIPFHIPLISYIFNNLIANIWPLSRAGLVHFAVMRQSSVPVLPPNPSISIIVPARNEAGTIEKIARSLPELGSFTEIIFVEGNSTDNTWDVIEKVAQDVGRTRKIKYVRQDGKGKGDAVRKGFDIAEGDILTIYDADMTVPAEDLGKFYNAIVSNRADFVNGSRLVYPVKKQSMRVLNYFGNKFFSMAFSWILSQPLKDTLCGTKMISRENYERIKENRSFFGDFDPFGDFDLLFGAAKLNLKIVDLPIRYQERTYGTTNISRFSHGWLLLKMTAFAARKLKFI